MPPQPISVHHANASASTYSLHYVGESSGLVTPNTPSYGATMPHSPTQPSSRTLIWNAALKMALIFCLSTLFLGGTLYLALPTLEEADKPLLRIPKSFAQLQDLNHLLKKYRDVYPYRIVYCYVVTYFFLQAFSLPGSMYLSILGGAVWGVARALPLACFCVATGATICYLISAALGPALLTLPKWKARLDNWAAKIEDNKENLISFLIVLRIAPLPPHWVVNVICPHIGIDIWPFWISTFFGIFGVTVIHTTIGGGLDSMTSADDFHLISWRNFFMLAAIAVGVLIPVGLRRYFRKEVGAVSDVEVREHDHDGYSLASGEEPELVRPAVAAGPADDEFSDDDDDNVILDPGPGMPMGSRT